MDVVLRRIICRTCLTEASDYKSLQSKMDGDRRTLREVLSNFTNMDILLSDKYPKQVCNECYTMLFKADEFKKRCLQSETILKNGFLSHTFEELIKKEMVNTEHTNVADTQANIIVDNSYYDSYIKNNPTGTGDIEMAVVENYYDSEDNLKNDIDYVKEEPNDYLRDDISDLAEGVAERTPVIVNMLDVINLKQNTKVNDKVVEKSEINIRINEISSVCTVCHKEFANFALLKQHSLTHKENNVHNENYQCTECSSNFTCKLSLKSHLKTHKIKAKVKHKKTKHNIENKNGLNLILICPNCKEKFTNMRTFQSHLKTHKNDNEPNVNIENIIKVNNDNKNYQCSLCTRKFVRRSSLVTHIKRHEDRAQIKYTCKTCKREFQHKAHLENHVVLVHSKDKGFMCDICNKSFSTQESLDSHKDRHKVNRKHECKVCSKSFTMLSTLTEHLKIHTGEKPYLCAVCGRGFSQKNNMTQHMRRHQGLKPFKCDTCERGFVSKGELDAHARKHSGAHPFVCDDCGGSFTTSSSLTKHRRIHTGERPYACDLCPMRFTVLNTLKNHRRTHTGEKPYQCSLCEKAFTQRNDLVSHIRCHTGERPYICTCCGQAFRKASALKVHIKSHIKVSG